MSCNEQVINPKNATYTLKLWAMQIYRQMIKIRQTKA